MKKAAKLESEGATSTHPIVALTGFMGSGKTTVGQELAELLEWEFVDLDEAIERSEGVAIREIFRMRGEAEFRRIEQVALRALLGDCSRPMVVALGGGTFVQPDNLELLHHAGARSVFLEVSLDEMLRRCAGAGCEEQENLRPLARDKERFRRLYQERLPAYRRAELIVDADGKTASEIAQLIAKALALGQVS